MKYQLILASESPRRKQLLEQAGFKFRVHPSKISEIPKEKLNVEEQILDLSRQKARTVFEALKRSEKNPFLILAADTEVIFGGKTLGKPSEASAAHQMLKSLSGKKHQVITAIWMIESLTGLEAGIYEASDVWFKTLSDEKIWSYVQTGDPMDKAGAYGIQGPGRELIDRFDGSLDNIMGLPVQKVWHLIKTHSWEIA